MTLNRLGATTLIHERKSQLRGRLLEVGVGDDPYPDLVAQRVSVDISERYAPDVVADAHHLPFRSGAFDSVLASQVLEHLHSPWQAVEEIARVHNRNTGAVIIAVPFLFPLHQTPADYFRFTEWGLRRLLESHFVVSEVVGFGGRLAVLIDHVFTTMPSSSVPRRAARAARKRLVGSGARNRSRLLTQIMVRRAAEFPCGYVVVCV